MSYQQQRKRKKTAARHQLFLPSTGKMKIKTYLGVPGYTGEQLIKMDPCRWCSNMQSYGDEGSMRCWVPDPPEKPEDKLETCFSPMKGIEEVV